MIEHIRDLLPLPPWEGPPLPERWTEKRHFYGYLVEKDYLYQIWEWRRLSLRVRHIRGEIRPYSKWRDVPRKHWVYMASDGRIYYDIYPEGYHGRGLGKPLARIVDILVTKRGIGMGRRLVELAENRILAYGITRVEGSSARDARTFWQHLGYTLSDGEMRKELALPSTRRPVSPI